MFNACLGLLTGSYLSGVAYGMLLCTGWSRVVLSIGHLAVLGLLLSRARAVDLSSPKSISEFYIGVLWKAFYAEYLLIPFFR